MLWTAQALAEPKSLDVFQKLEELNRTREALANTIQRGSEISEETFAAVCKPVGAELQRWAKSNGLVAKQMSHKARNPNHSLSNELANAYKEFQRDEKLQEKTVTTGTSKLIWMKRIVVAKACLNCHGSKTSRPEFIVAKYPNDKAYGFQVGDLRGVYVVSPAKEK